MAAVLQLPEAALDVGISQPDGLRDKVACRQREARRIIAQLWETPNAGKVIVVLRAIVEYPLRFDFEIIHCVSPRAVGA